MRLNELADLVHENAKEKGWWECPPTFLETMMLCVSELSEAVEEYRKFKGVDEVYYVNEKPEGIPIELADVIIRILDVCGRHDIDIDGAIRQKMKYNKTREYKHGGKKI